MADGKDFLKFLVRLIIWIIVTWVVLSLVLMWAEPSLTNENSGGINWWTTLWVTAVVTIILIVVDMLIIYMFGMVAASNGMTKPCSPCNKDQTTWLDTKPCSPCNQDQKSWLDTRTVTK